MSNFWENVFASSVVLLVMMLLMAVVMAIISMRGTSKRRKHFEQLHTQLKSGQKIVTSSGIYGKVKGVSEETVDVEVKSGAVITVSRFTIAEIISDK